MAVTNPNSELHDKIGTKKVRAKDMSYCRFGKREACEGQKDAARSSSRIGEDEGREREAGRDMLTIGGSGVEEKSPSDLGSTRSDGGTNMASSEWMSCGNGGDGALVQASIWLCSPERRLSRRTEKRLLRPNGAAQPWRPGLLPFWSA